MDLVEPYLYVGALFVVVIFVVAPVAFGGNPAAFGRKTPLLMLGTFLLWPLVLILLFALMCSEDGEPDYE